MLAGIIIAVAVLIFWAVIINNNLISKKNRVLQAFSSIDVYLKERFDLIPNLIATLEKYMDHEKNTLVEITRLRSELKNSVQNSEKIEISNKLGTLISDINFEDYPELKADKQFTMLQSTLKEMEDKLAASRRAYNAAVTDFNNKIEQFPSIIIAKIRAFKQEKVLETAHIEKQNIDVSASLNL